MITNGGQARDAAFTTQACKVIWLGEALPLRLHAGNAARPTTSLSLPGICASRSNRAKWIGSDGVGGLMLASLAVIGQTAALLPMLDTKSGTHSWLAAALFGLGVALAARMAIPLIGKGAGEHHALRAIPGDFALHDAFTLALVAAASNVIGNGAILLLPAIVALSHTVLRVTRRRTVDSRDTTLAVVTLIAIGGLCGSVGLRGWIACLTALMAGSAARAGYKNSYRSRLRPIWHKWTATALLCAAIAAIGSEGTSLTLADLPLVAALVSGAVYGAAAQAAALGLNRSKAQLISGAAPFLAFAAEVLVNGSIRQEQLAAAALLAFALFMSSIRARAA